MDAPVAEQNSLACHVHPSSGCNQWSIGGSFDHADNVDTDASDSMGRWDHLLNVVLYILFAEYFGITAAVLSVFQCRRDPFEGESYMIHAPWIACSLEGEWLWLIVLSLVGATLYVLGTPLLFALLLYRSRDRLRQGTPSRGDTHRIGFLFAYFTPRCYWYELISLGRRLCIAATLSLVSPSDPLQQFLFVTVLCSFLTLHYLLQPYRTTLENKLEVVSTCVVLLVYIISSVLFLHDENGATSTTFVVASTWLMALVVFGFYVLHILPVKMKRYWRYAVDARDTVTQRCRT